MEREQPITAPSEAEQVTAWVDAWLDAFEGPDRGPTRPEAWLTDDAVFIEHPNAVNPAGTKRDRASMMAGVEAGRALLARQVYRDRRHLVTGPRSAVTRARWEGELAIDAGPWPAGTVLKADIAMFIDFDADGRVQRQENFDCYLPVGDTAGG